MHAWGCVWEHCVQANQCLSENWPCVCLRECIFFSTICMPVCLHQTPHVYCILHIQVCPLCVFERACVCVYVLVWLGAAPAVSEWAAPNAWTPRRGRKGGVRGRVNQERDEWGEGRASEEWMGETKGLSCRSRWQQRKEEKWLAGLRNRV